jgi:hypothetical protein
VAAAVTVAPVVAALHFDGDDDGSVAMTVVVAVATWDHDAAGHQAGHGQQHQTANGHSNCVQFRLQAGHPAGEATTGLAARR